MSIVLCIGVPRRRVGEGRCLKIWLENFQGKLWFQGKRKLFRNLECYKIFQYSEKYQGNSVFQGKRRVAQKSLMVKNIFNAAKNFRASSVFHGKSKLLKNPERWKNFQYSVYSLGGDPCNLGKYIV